MEHINHSKASLWLYVFVALSSNKWKIWMQPCKCKVILMWAIIHRISKSIVYYLQASIWVTGILLGNLTLNSKCLHIWVACATTVWNNIWDFALCFQPISNFSSKKCKRCGLYEEDSITSDDAFDEWEFCPSDFTAPDGEYIKFKEKEFNATFMCPDCLNLAGGEYLATFCSDDSLLPQSYFMLFDLWIHQLVIWKEYLWPGWCHCKSCIVYQKYAISILRNDSCSSGAYCLRFKKSFISTNEHATSICFCVGIAHHE